MAKWNITPESVPNIWEFEMAKKETVNINNLSENELACYILKMAKELPHRYIITALPKARDAITQFISASIRLARFVRKP